jgi:hypothetical protein
VCAHESLATMHQSPDTHYQTEQFATVKRAIVRSTKYKTVKISYQGEENVEILGKYKTVEV